MRRALLTFCLTFLTAAFVQAQDFVSKFMLEHHTDTLLQCISVGPKMMVEVLKTDTQDEDQEEMRQIISKLKSMQIVSSPVNGAHYFGKAEEIAAKNAGRFTLFLSYDEEQENCRILTRKKRKTIIELVLICRRAEQFQVINFTGTMNDEFIDRLVRTVLPEKPETE